MKKFNLTEEHIKLLRKSWVEWDYTEFGAAQIDPKRPYGNSDVPRDIVEILWGDEPTDEDGEYDSELYDRASSLHPETETALQIVLATGKFEPGLYINEGWGLDWRLKDD